MRQAQRWSVSEPPGRFSQIPRSRLMVGDAARRGGGRQKTWAIGARAVRLSCFRTLIHDNLLKTPDNDG